MKLLINADDAGIDASRNRGIFEAIDKGVVRNISVIVYQPGWVDVLDRISGREDIGIGLHVNLTAGRPLIDGHKTLVKDHGFFFDKFELFQRAHEGLIDPKEATVEFLAQLEKFESSGIKPTHINGHNHVHIYPGLREGFAEAFSENAWVRLPIESGNAPAASEGVDTFDGAQNSSIKKEKRAPLSINPEQAPSLSPGRVEWVDLKAIYDDSGRLVSVFNFLAFEAKKLWGNRFRYVDDFRGTKITHPSPEAFIKAIGELKGEVCELMCHPGAQAPDDSARFSTLKERQLELEALTSPQLKKFLDQKRIELVSFRDLP